MRPNIHILGIQGSGKGTQSALLVEKYRLNYLPSGNLFRERAEVNDQLGQEIKQALGRGHLLPDNYLIQTVIGYLESHQVQHGLLGDGVIRTVSQYDQLLTTWEHYQLESPFLVHLILDEATARERIAHREQEQIDQAKREYHLTYSGKLLRRNDSNHLAIEERFVLFHQLTTPVVQRFTEAGRCLDVSANQSVAAIQAEICQGLEQRYPTLQHGTDQI